MAAPLRFSIITCTRNSMATLPDTLRSIQGQQGVSWEHVFVDGNSQDGTLQALQQLSGNVRIVPGVEGGIARAMNAGIAAAHGDVLAHLHADDYYLHPQVLSQVERRMQTDGCDLLFGRIVSDVAGQLVPEPFAPPRFDAQRLLRRNFIPHPATFVRRSVFERYGVFNEHYRLAMDYEFWLRIRHRCTFGQIDEPLAAFRVHAGSASQAHARASFHEDFRARLKHGPWWMWPEFAGRYAVRRWRGEGGRG
jgi:glycosyltransferase involved in cell wall biosynthesis